MMKVQRYSCIFIDCKFNQAFHGTDKSEDQMWHYKG